MLNRNNPINPDSNRNPEGGWVRNPYGINISSDETTLYNTLSEGLDFALGGESQDTKTKQSVERWQEICNAIALADADKPESIEALGQGEIFYCKQGYTDTSVGGNDAINPYWQFNRDDDIVPPSLRNMHKKSGASKRPGSAVEGDSGMGRVYSEMYDDHQQLLWISAGVPVFSNIAAFLYDAGCEHTANLMTTGNHTGLIGKMLSYAKTATWWAVTLPIMAPIYMLRWCSNFNNEPITKFYSFKPTQSLYLELVNTMMSYLAVGMGLYPQFGFTKRPEDKNLTKQLSDKEIDEMVPAGIPEDKIPEMRKMIRTLLQTNSEETGIPELLKRGPDIFKILNKRNVQFGLIGKEYSTRDITQAAGELQKGGIKQSEDAKNLFVGHNRDSARITIQDLEAKRVAASNKAKSLGNRSKGYSEAVADWHTLEAEMKERIAAGESLDKEQSRSLLSQSELSIKSAILGIGDYVGFRIEKSVGASEGVSNSTGSSGMSDKVNGYAASRQDARMSYGGSKVLQVAASGTGGVESMVKELATMVGATFMGKISSVLVNGNGYLDIPDVWKNSSFSKSHTFNIQLRARYGDPVSIYQSIYIPLLMLLAYAMPRAAGKNMYTSPFIVRCYCKGMFSIPCGMVESINITRGASEYGWNEGSLPTSVDVSLTIKDLSPTFFLSMDNIGFGDLFSSNTNMMEYLDTLSGLGIVEKLYLMPKLMRKATAMFLINRNTTFSPMYWSQRIGRSPMLRAMGSVLPLLDFESTKRK